MKKIKLILTLVLMISAVNTFSQNELSLTNLHFFPEGEFINSNQTIVVKSFYLSNQVTNAEFKEFWNSIKNNPDNEFEWVDISKPTDASSKSLPTIKKIKYSELAKISFNQENWPSENYFESKEYNNCPVIGVPTELQRFFCIWLTDKNFADLANNGINSSSNFYLPSDRQIEYAKKTDLSFFSDNELGFRVAITK